VSTKLTFDAATAALGRLWDGEPLAPIAHAAGLTERAMSADLSAFLIELRTIVEAARPTARRILVTARGALADVPQDLPPGCRIIQRGEL